jgi:hypothetical protein
MAYWIVGDANDLLDWEIVKHVAERFTLRDEVVDDEGEVKAGLSGPYETFATAKRALWSRNRDAFAALRQRQVELLHTRARSLRTATHN